MKNLLLVMTALLVISGIVSANMWRELRTSRQLIADLQTQLTEAKGSARLAAMPALASAPTRLPSPAPATSALASAPTKADPPPAAATAAAMDNAAFFRRSQAQERELMKDPEYRKARIAQQSLTMAQNYPGLAEELGLSEKEAAQLFALLAENQMNLSSEMSITFTAGGTPDPAAMEDLRRKQQAIQRQQEDSVAALLGSARYTQWQEYQQTQGSRMQVSQINSRLAQAGQPMTTAQTKALTSVMIAEQARQNQEVQVLLRGINTADPQSRARMLEEARKLESEGNRRVLDAAAPSLSAQQLAALKLQFEQQNAENQAAERMQRERQRLQPGNP